MWRKLALGCYPASRPQGSHVPLKASGFILGWTGLQHYLPSQYLDPFRISQPPPLWLTWVVSEDWVGALSPSLTPPSSLHADLPSHRYCCAPTSHPGANGSGDWDHPEAPGGV